MPDTEWRWGFMRPISGSAEQAFLAHRRLTPEEKDEFLARLREIYNIKPILIAYEVCRTSYDDLVYRISELSTNRNMIYGRDDLLIDITIQRLCSSFIAACSGFLNQTDAIAKRKFSPKAHIWLERKQIFRDHHFAFRLITFLRNYSQHDQLPVHWVTTELDWKSEESAYSTVVKADLTTEKLLHASERELKRYDLKAELIRCGKNIPLMPLLEQHMECMTTLCGVAVGCLPESASILISYSGALRRLVNAPDDADILVWEDLLPKPEGNLEASTIKFPSALVEMIRNALMWRHALLP